MAFSKHLVVVSEQAPNTMVRKPEAREGGELAQAPQRKMPARVDLAIPRLLALVQPGSAVRSRENHSPVIQSAVSLQTQEVLSWYIDSTQSARF